MKFSLHVSTVESRQVLTTHRTDESRLTTPLLLIVLVQLPVCFRQSGTTLATLLTELSSMETNSARTLKRPPESSNSGFDCTNVIVQRLQIEREPKAGLFTVLHD